MLPFALTQVGTTWVRITNFAILYVMLALGLNIVVGFAGLLDLGYIAFYAVGAYVYALLASPQFGLHLPFWVILPIGAAVAALFGVLLGAPTLKLRGDYLAIVTLGFGEIIRIFLNNLSRPVNITNGPQGIAGIDPVRSAFAAALRLRHARSSTTTCCSRWRSSSSSSTCGCRTRASAAPGRRSARTRSRRAPWASTRATSSCSPSPWARASAASPAACSPRSRRFISPESFVLVESIMVVSMVVLGGMGNIWGVILGALLLSFVPEILRWTVTPVQEALFGRMLIEPEVIRMLLFGLALVLVMLFRPAGLLPSAVRKRELERARGMSRPARGTSGIAKRFGGVQALNDVSFTIAQGRDLRPDRAERRRQDHAVQRAHRHLCARRRRDSRFDGATSPA